MNDDAPGPNRAKQLIQDRQERLEDTLDVVSHRAANLDVSPELTSELAVHILNYHRMLATYRDESAVSDDDFPDVGPIRNRLGETVEITTDSKRRGRGRTVKEVPAVEELDFRYLERVADQLEQVAKKLGFWADAATKTPHNQAAQDDLEALLGARGQDDAVANLNGRGGEP